MRACKNKKEKRYTIKCIWNADKEFDPPKLIKKLATKTPKEVFDILSSPDVVLTNAKDKELMLPVVGKTNEHVKDLFVRANAKGELPPSGGMGTEGVALAMQQPLTGTGTGTGIVLREEAKGGCCALQ